ncbi:MAG: anaerobic ribonucleoside-triphosphate reductase activating protein [Muribaculaceae bacterium]|nr:anaerobic ribonucleoside-triphosphate reductase activating protein [Muribaculaceae bacterium]
MSLRVISIIDGTTVDGPGFRTAIYFAGCRHQCPGCHNPQSWDFEAGQSMAVEDIMNRIESNGMNVSFSGGDPLYQADKLLPLCKAIKSSGKNIWLYTGFLFEQIAAMPEFSALLEYIDVIVDGPFVEHLRDTSLLFRGSSNQRLVDVRRSLSGDIVEWQPDF